MEIVTLIMAAGKGTRMKSDLAKVLHSVNGQPMIYYVIDLARKVGSSRVIAIIGHQKDRVRETLSTQNIEFVVQDPQLGTGHAVMQAQSLLNDYDGNVLVLSGDVPLLSVETIKLLLREHVHQKATATVLTTRMADPAGYGRVIRNEDGSVLKIVEHKDATEEERRIDEINSGIYVFAGSDLFNGLHKTDSNNAQREYYLPDVLKVFMEEGKRVCAVTTGDAGEITGINTVEQLTEAEQILKNRTKER